MAQSSFDNFTQLLLFPWNVKKLTAGFLRFPGCGSSLPFVSIVFILIISKSTLKSLVRLHSEKEAWLLSFMNSLGYQSLHLISVGCVFYSLLRVIELYCLPHTKNRSFGFWRLVICCILGFLETPHFIVILVCYRMVLLVVMWGFGEIKKWCHCCHHPRILINSKTFKKMYIVLKALQYFPTHTAHKMTFWHRRLHHR